MTTARFSLVLALLYAVLLGIFGLLFLVLSASLPPAQQELLAQLLSSRLQLLFALALLLLLGLGAALNALQSRYLQPLARLSEDVALLSANPEHRATAQGATVVRVLTDKINTLATNFQMLQSDVQTRIAQANRALAGEKNRLAALMSELAQCVLVCNIEGRILLYNTRATELLEVHDATGTTIGLGRSIFGVIDRDLIVHALEQIQHQRQQTDDPAARPVSDFVATLANGQLVRAHMAAVLDGSNALDGFVLTLEDITRNVAAESQRDALLQLLTQDTRAALANIRAALETMQHFPDMSSQKRSQFTAIIDDESQRLAHQINQAEQGRSTSQSEGWRFEQMRGIDLIALLQRRIETPALRIDSSSDSIDSALWLEVDSYALTQSLAYLTQRLAAHCDVDTLHLDLQRTERLAYLDIVWRGAPVAVETLQSWENTPFQLGATIPSTTLTAVITGQGGEAVYQFDPIQQTSRYRLLLPLATERAALDIRIKKSARPEFYDFDLFRQSGQTAALDQQLLSQLSYTVFDTETTGLQPAAGDEIISLGALHIVNGRLLSHENFDQLVQPKRKLSAESTAIHGINDAMLIGQPAIEKVLPQFHRFAQDTILVAHNAAFDMRFLQMLEVRTGICFTQPVLDTLLLSQVIHPNQAQHSLEAIATRLGVDLVGRHTALGDAIVTAEVLLRMVPLLAEKGIFTLKQARDAAQQTPYARIHY